MITKYISGNELIGRIDHDLSFDNSDWITKAPLWIADCLALMDVIPALQAVYVDVEIVDYQCNVPLSLKILDRVVVNDIPLIPHQAFNAKFNSSTELINHATRYSTRIDEASLNTIMIFGVETGTARFYYHIPAVEAIDEYHVIMPKVIDDIFVFETVKYFILMRMLQRGYKHPVYDLTSNNPFTNAGLLWKEYQDKARNSVSTLDQAELKVLFDVQREFIKNYDYFYNEGFIPIITA
jgi:hypothetical protein